MFVVTSYHSVVATIEIEGPQGFRIGRGRYVQTP